MEHVEPKRRGEVNFVSGYFVQEKESVKNVLQANAVTRFVH